MITKSGAYICVSGARHTRSCTGRLQYKSHKRRAGRWMTHAGAIGVPLIATPRNDDGFVVCHCASIVLMSVPYRLRYILLHQYMQKQPVLSPKIPSMLHTSRRKSYEIPSTCCGCTHRVANPHNTACPQRTLRRGAGCAGCTPCTPRCRSDDAARRTYPLRYWGCPVDGCLC